MRINYLFLLLTALALSAPNAVRAEDDDGETTNITIEEEDGKLKLRFPKSPGTTHNIPDMDDEGRLVPAGKGLLNKATGTYYEPAGAKGYRNRKTGAYERAWTCYPAR